MSDAETLSGRQSRAYTSTNAWMMATRLILDQKESEVAPILFHGSDDTSLYLCNGFITDSFQATTTHLSYTRRY